MVADKRRILAGESADADSADLYLHLVESVTDYAIFALDAGGTVVSWNPGAQRIKGYRREEIIGRHFSTFYAPEDVAAGKPARVLETARREGRYQEEGWRVRKGGIPFWADVVISAIRDEDGSVAGFAKTTRDLTERRRAEEAVRQSNERFQLLVQSVKDYAIILLDPEGKITTWNEGAERIKGYKSGEIIGQSFTRFYPEEVVAAGFPMYELEVAAREGRFEDESWRVRKDGTRFWGNVVITALRSPDGELVGFAKVTRDLTSRREAEEQARRLAEAEASRELAAQLQRTNVELQAALRDAEAARRRAERATAEVIEAYRELDQFAYAASHDLKAPLRGIANLAHWIVEDSGERLSAESGEHIRLLQGRVRRMEALIDGILAYSRAGRTPTEPEPVDIGALLREVVDLLAPPPEVTIRFPDAMPVIETERVPLQQVFSNLIGNAIKHSLAGRPDVRIDIACEDHGDDLAFLINDNGPGIAPEFHERIWGMFQTLASRDKVEGTGVGLSIVKKLVESRGGTVAVESAPDKGAAFRFTWPKQSRRGSRA